MNAPKKIWFDIEECSAGPVQFSDDEIPYIRADIVDELVEALAKLSMLYDSMGAPRGPCRIFAETALKKLEESND